jgi:hypothetical protein
VEGIEICFGRISCLCLQWEEWFKALFYRNYFILRYGKYLKYKIKYQESHFIWINVEFRKFDTILTVFKLPLNFHVLYSSLG